MYHPNLTYPYQTAQRGRYIEGYYIMQETVPRLDYEALSLKCRP